MYPYLLLKWSGLTCLQVQYPNCRNDDDDDESNVEMMMLKLKEKKNRHENQKKRGQRPK